MTPDNVIETLEAAHITLRWYRDMLPGSVNGSDDEMDAQIEAAVEWLRGLGVQEPVAKLHDDGYWTPMKTEAGRSLNDRLMRAGSPPIDVYASPVDQQYEAGDMASAAAQGFRDGVASVAQQPQADEKALSGKEVVYAGWERHQYAQGTKECIAFMRGARWWSERKAQQPQAEPDAYCITTRDGGCISTDPRCMHQPQAEVLTDEQRLGWFAWRVNDLEQKLTQALKQQAKVVPEGYKLLKDTTHQDRSWPEDAAHENGCYHNTCINCLRGFTGHKRRGICRACDAQTQP